LSTPVLAVVTLLVLTIINCFGVRAGSNVQSALMVLKILAIAMLVIVGFAVGAKSGGGGPDASRELAVADSSGALPLVALGAAMVPVLFAYGGWQTASFVSGEMTAPRRDLPRALLIGVLGVVVLYVGVNLVC